MVRLVRIYNCIHIVISESTSSIPRKNRTRHIIIHHSSTNIKPVITSTSNNAIGISNGIGVSYGLNIGRINGYSYVLRGYISYFP